MLPAPGVWPGELVMQVKGDPKTVVAVAFLNMFNTLLAIIPDEDQETLGVIEEAVDHINRFIDGRETLDIDFLMESLGKVLGRIREETY